MLWRTFFNPEFISFLKIISNAEFVSEHWTFIFSLWAGARLHLSVCSGAGDRVAGCRKRQSSDQQRSPILTWRFIIFREGAYYHLFPSFKLRNLLRHCFKQVLKPSPKSVNIIVKIVELQWPSLQHWSSCCLLWIQYFNIIIFSLININFVKVLNKIVADYAEHQAGSPSLETQEASLQALLRSDSELPGWGILNWISGRVTTFQITHTGLSPDVCCRPRLPPGQVRLSSSSWAVHHRNSCRHFPRVF